MIARTIFVVQLLFAHGSSLSTFPLPMVSYLVDVDSKQYSDTVFFNLR